MSRTAPSPGQDSPAIGPHAHCLVGGTGRSGTTLLRQVFSLHPNVATLSGEARFLSDPDGVADFLAGLSSYWSPYVFDVRVRRLESLLRDLGRPGRMGRLTPVTGTAPARRSGASGGGRLKAPMAAALARSGAGRLLPRYWSVDLEAECPAYSELVDELIRRLVAFKFAGRWMGAPRRQASSLLYGTPDVTDALRWFCREFAARVCTRQAASHFVEDTPFNLLAFDVIRRLLPESRLVHIYRDPRDVVASYMSRRWSPSDPELGAKFYVGVMRRWEKIREELSAESYIEVGLSDLVDKPEPVLRRICDFWELPWRDELLTADLTRSNRGRWRDDIPARHVERVHVILESYIERYGE